MTTWMGCSDKLIFCGLILARNIMMLWLEWLGFKQRNWRYKWRLIFTDSWPGLAGWHPQPDHYTTTTQHHTHTFRKHCPVLHAHFIHSRAVSLITLSLWFLTNQLQFDTSWKLIELRVLLTVCISILNNEIKPTINVLILFIFNLCNVFLPTEM